MSDARVREDIVRRAASLYDRGLSFGSSGNISVRLDDGWLMTPTGSSMGELDPARLSLLDPEGRHISGDAPTKEAFLHMAMYAKRSGASAIVHLHSTHSVAVSCLKCINHKDVLPPLTAYYVMRVGKLPLLPYFAPGDIELARAVGEMASDHHAVLLANHGPVVSGKSLSDTIYATEELEETAKLFLALRAMETRPLTAEQVAELQRRFLWQT